MKRVPPRMRIFSGFFAFFDVFAGQGVPEGKKSVAVEVTLQPGEKTFTDAEIKAVSEAVVASAAKLGAELRG